MKPTVTLLVLGVFLSAAVAVAHADRGRYDDDTRTRGFVEGTFAYGLQFGTTPYVPTQDGTRFKHPITHGFGAGAMAGVKILPGLFAVGQYEFVRARSRSGQIAGAVDDIDGKITYHTATVGLRVEKGVGPGRVFGQLTLGVLFPFETRLRYEYAPGLAQLPEPITGEGRRVSEFGFGAGGQAVMGYQIPLHDRIYLAPAVKLSTFTTNNNGERIRLENFVVDFEELAAVDAEIRHDRDATRAGQPTTYSVQDLRVMVALGARF